MPLRETASPPRNSQAAPLDGSAFAQIYQIPEAKTPILSDTAIPLRLLSLPHRLQAF